MRIEEGMKKIFYCFTILLFTLSAKTFGQDLTQATHETNDQKSIDITFSEMPAQAPSAASFEVTANGNTIKILAVNPIEGKSYRIFLHEALPVDPDPVIVNYLPKSSRKTSENNRPVLCTDFEWETNTRPTPSCAPVDPINKMVFSIKPGARNSSNFDLSKISSIIKWNDPANTKSSIAAYESEESGVKKTGTNFITFDADLDDFHYPADDDGCSYSSEWRVYINGEESCMPTDPNQFISYTSHNVDDKGTGKLDIHPKVRGSENVCLNDEADVQFRDTSILNCIEGTETPNNEGRWVRVIYGAPSRDSNQRIPNVYIKGIQVTDDNGNLIDPHGAGDLKLTAKGIVYTGNGADIFGVKFFPAPVDKPVGGFLPITTVSTDKGFANRKPGDKFIVRMEYWNICNPYDEVGNIIENERATAEEIVIVDIPNPPVANQREVCFGESAGNFSISEVNNSIEIKWYDADPAAGGKAINNPLGNNSLTLPAAEIVDSKVSGVYSVWATVISSDNGRCESDATQVNITVKDQLSKPEEIIGLSQICNNSNDIEFTVSEEEGSSEFGGEWEYFWKHTGGGGVTFDKNIGQTVSVDFNINSLKQDSVIRTIQVVKRYKNSPESCTEEKRTINITIYNSSLGGNISSDESICEGESTGVLTLKDYRGEVITWQKKSADSDFTDIAGTAGLTEYSEIISAAGSYSYRAVVANSICDPVYSSTASILVNEIPTKPVITDATGDGLTICEGAGEVKLIASGSGREGEVFEWYSTADLAKPVKSSKSNELVLSGVAHSGKYVVKVIGTSPSKCESEFSEPVSVIINPLPSATASGGGSVCAGNPAPDIVWYLTGVAPFSFRISVSGQPDIVESNYNANIYTIAAPKPEATTEYKMVSLFDASNCSTGALGDVVKVTIGGTPPVLDNPIMAGAAICEDGSNTLIPAITIDLDKQGSYAVVFTINGGENKTLSFNTNNEGIYKLRSDFNTAPYNSESGVYTYNFISISNLTTGCLTPVNENVVITINPKPTPPTNPVDVIICSDSEAGGQLSVDNPGAGFSVRWFTSYTNNLINTPVNETDGEVSGSGNTYFTPAKPTPSSYYAAIQNNTTGCLSSKAVEVKQILDIKPTSIADIDDDETNNITCSDEFALRANASEEEGTWTGPEGVIFNDIHDPEAVVSNLPLGKTTLRWTVKSLKGICVDAFNEVIVERYDIPQAIDPQPVLCAEDLALEVKDINLEDYKEAITGIDGAENIVVSWFSDPKRTKKIVDATSYTANNLKSKTVYTRVTNTLTNCYNEGTLTFTILQKPIAIDITDELCEDVLNQNEVKAVDLTAYNKQITANADNRTIRWFSDASFTVPVPTPTSVTVNNEEVFYALVTDTSTPAACMNEATLTFTVNSLPENNPIQGPSIQCAGSTIQLYQVTPSIDPGVTYSWNIPAEYKLFGGGGAKDFFVLLNFPDTATVDLEVTEISSSGCAGNTQKLQIKVVDSPQPLTISPINPEICENEQGVVFNVENLANTTYAWTVPAGASIIKGQGTNEIVVNFGLFGGNVQVVPTSAAGNCAGESAITKVTVNQRPQLSTALNNSVCSNETAGITLSYLASGTPATSYNIINIAADPGLIRNESNADTGENQAASAIFNDVFTNKTGQPQTVRYTVQPISSKGCAGPSSVFTLTIQPEPILNSSLNKERCSGEISDIMLAVAPGSFPAASYSILSATIGGDLRADSSNVTFDGAFPYHGVASDFLRHERFRNFTSNPVDMKFEVQPISNGCVGESQFITLTINPEPFGTNITGPKICSGDKLQINLQDYISNNVESDFIWTATYDATIQGGMFSGAGNISEVLTNKGETEQSVIYTIYPTAKGQSSCAGTPFTITIPVEPAIVANDLKITICSSETLVDLTKLEQEVTGGNRNVVDWFSDLSLNNPIATPEKYDVKNINVLYARVSNGNCFKTAKINYSLTSIEITTVGVTSNYNGYDLSCNGASDASVKFIASGGTAPYNYILNEEPANITGSLSGEFIGLATGSYTVTVTDSNGCTSEIVAPAVVNNPLPLNAGMIFGNPNICSGNLPSKFQQISAPVGGIGNYIYQWEVSKDGIVFATANGATANAAEYEAVNEDFHGGDGEFYFRRIVSSGDNVSCSEIASNVIKVTVNPLPSGDFKFTDTNGNAINEICAGEPFLIEFDFGSGASDYTFDYHDDKGNNYRNVYGTSKTPVLVNFDKVNSTTTFTLERVTDIYGCQLDAPLNISHTLYVVGTDAEFAVVGANDACSPSAIEFKYNQVKGVTYTWRWFDGSEDSTYTATATVPNKKITHLFNNGSPTATINYEVYLIASTSSSSGTTCESYTSEKVTVYPRVMANVFAQTQTVCSNEEIKLINLSLGASNHKWFYRELGNIGQENQLQLTKEASFTIENNGPNNPQVYEIIYTGSTQQNGGNTCTDTQIILVEVYKKIEADFTYTVPSYNNGYSTVSFTNTSLPNNDHNFSYHWDFDDGIVQNVMNPTPVTYTNPGRKVVTLTISNNAAPGLCDVTVKKTIDIASLPIVADFSIKNDEVCRGTEVTIINHSNGEANEFTWQIFDEYDVLVYQQIETIKPEVTRQNPSVVFKTTRAGVYSVQLTARNTYTDALKVELKKAAFEVYELPVANFDTRPDVVSIPDQSLITYNLSDNADAYSWDFGDGSDLSTAFEPEHNYTQEGTYTVTLTASRSYPGDLTCIDKVSKSIVAESGGGYKLPNAFTPSPYGPSGDGRIQNEEANDIFLPITTGVVDFHMAIYNRWGELLFQSTDSAVGWDGYSKNGNIHPAGVYIYKLTLKFSNGQRKQIAGDVTLIN